MVVWIIGLAGCGKTTVGRLLYEKWKAHDPATVLVDGDEVRSIFKHDTGDDPYSIEGRRLNADRICEICAWMDRQDINVVCCILSLFEESRTWNRETYSQYLEVYLEAPDIDLAARRPIYDRAKQGLVQNVVGVDIPFTPPLQPDLIFDTSGQVLSASQIADAIWKAVLGHLNAA